MAAAESQPLGICISDLTIYIDFIGEEEERQVVHAMKLTVAVATTEVTIVAQNVEIYKESCSFERDRQERQRAYELRVTQDAAVAGVRFHSSSS